MPLIGSDKVRYVLVSSFIDSYPARLFMLYIVLSNLAFLALLAGVASIFFSVVLDILSLKPVGDAFMDASLVFFGYFFSRPLVGFFTYIYVKDRELLIKSRYLSVREKIYRYIDNMELLRVLASRDVYLRRFLEVGLRVIAGEEGLVFDREKIMAVLDSVDRYMFRL